MSKYIHEPAHNYVLSHIPTYSPQLRLVCLCELAYIKMFCNNNYWYNSVVFVTLPSLSWNIEIGTLNSFLLQACFCFPSCHTGSKPRSPSITRSTRIWALNTQVGLCTTAIPRLLHAYGAKTRMCSIYNRFFCFVEVHADGPRERRPIPGIIVKIFQMIYLQPVLFCKQNWCTYSKNRCRYKVR